jgi:hypothetical protein
MDVQIRGCAARFADLQPGSFFCALRAEPLFGLCVSDGATKGALVFSVAPNQNGIPWLADRGLPSDVLVKFPAAVLKAQLSSVAAASGSPPYGAIISNGEDYLIRASSGLGYTATFNVSTGMLAEPSNHSASIVFQQWQIGHYEHHEFEPLFTFP